MSENTVVASLSPRETEVLSLIAEGKTDDEISNELFIALATAKSHVRNILAKLGVRSRHQAAELFLNAR